MNELWSGVGVGYLVFPLLLALRQRQRLEPLIARASGSDAPPAAAPDAGALDEGIERELRAWLAAQPVQPGHDGPAMAPAAPGNLATHPAHWPQELMALYGFALDEKTLQDASFRACLELWSARILERQDLSVWDDIRLGPVLVPLLLACDRAHPGLLAERPSALAGVAGTLGTSTQALLRQVGLADAAAGAIAPWLGLLHGAATFRDELWKAATDPVTDPFVCITSALSRPASLGTLDLLEAHVLRQFEAPASGRPTRLAVLGDEDGTWTHRLLERIRAQDVQSGRPAAVAPRAIAVRLLGDVDEGAAPSRAPDLRPTLPVVAWHPALTDLDGTALADVLPVCLLAADRLADPDADAECRYLRWLVDQGAQAPVVWMRHGQVFADGEWAGGPLARLIAALATHLGRGSTLEGAPLLMRLGASGLFPRQQPQGFPSLARRWWGSLTVFEARNYRIRPGRAADLPTLVSLEAACWPLELRMPDATLARRVETHAEGQLVVEVDGEDGRAEVVGVIYSQRIGALDELASVEATTVDALHRRAGPIVQLLAVNVDPGYQGQGLGDQLLEFMLQRSSGQSDVASVAAVTLCKDFHQQSALDMQAYVRHRNGAGVLADPILRFHELHGASILKTLPGYRPRDTRNLGYGVLVAYDLARRARLEVWQQQARQAPAAGPALNGDATAPSLPDAAALHDFLATALRRILRQDESLPYAPDLPLMQAGLDSVGLLELAEALAAWCKVPLDATFLFRNNTPARVVAHFDALRREALPPASPGHAPESAGLERRSAARAPERPAPAVAPDAAPAGVSLPPGAIAIVGMACRLPGDLDTPEKFWECLEAGTCVVGSLPAGRWEWPQDIDPVRSHPGIDQGGFLSDIQSFDAGLFRLAPKEVTTMDPQQRLLLELAWEAMERAGYARDAMAGSNTGVYVGASGSDYRLLMESEGVAVEPHLATGGSMAVIANRISYTFDFRGPSLQIDTACSSSLVALHQAVQALRQGECDQALVAGVHLMCHPGNTVAYYKAGMLSRDGRCKTLDETANGYVRAEGGILFMLKPLERAMADGDPIHALIRGGACNHGGLTSGLTVPNPDRQADLLRAAWAASGVSAEAISHVEMHGTGTRLGDPIEVRGLTDAFLSRPGPAPHAGCAISSVKSNLGHLEAAAGLAGVLKVVLSMAHQTLPRTVNFNRLNAQIRLDGTPFSVVETLRPWPAGPQGAPRRAGVSSFGSGGANAHVVLEEYVPRAAPAVPAPAAGRELLFLMSAHTEVQLQARARRLLEHCQRCEREGSPLEAQALAYTLQRSQPMAHRLALVACSVGELVELLSAFLAGRGAARIFRSPAAGEASLAELVHHNTDVQDMVGAWLRDGRLDQVARWWAQGVEVRAWEGLYETLPRRLVLPCYPFARDRHWIPSARGPQHAFREASEAAQAYLGKPAMAATPGGQRLDIALEGSEFFLADHRLQGTPVLPGVAYLEFAREAWNCLSSSAPVAAAFQISDVAWLRPFLVSRPERLLISLVRQPARSGETAAEAYRYEAHGASDPSALHGYGTLQSLANEPAPRLDLPALQQALGREPLPTGRPGTTAEDCYQAFERMGLSYGPAHRALRSVRWGRDEAGQPALLADLALPPCVADSHAQFVLHPSLMDAALQAGLLLASSTQPDGTAAGGLPFSLRRLVSYGACPDRLWVWCRLRKGSAGARASLPAVDLALCDDTGRVWVRIEELVFRPLQARVEAPGSTQVPRPSSPQLLRMAWVDQPLAAVAAHGPEEAMPAGAHWVILCGERAQLDPQAVVLQASLPEASIQVMEGKAAGGDQGYADIAAQLFEFLQGLARRRPGDRVAVQVVVPGDGPGRVLQGLAGLARAVRMEHPWLVVQVLSFDASASLPALALQLRSNRLDEQAVQLRYRQGRRQVLVPEALQGTVAPTPGGPQPSPWREGGVYLITGGAGGLGLVFAREILARAQGVTVVLLGRSELTPAVRQSLQDLQAPAGAVVRYVAVDISHQAALDAALQDLLKTHGPLSGVIHAAGLTRDEFMIRKRRETFEAVLVPKVAGTINLYRSTRDCQLDFFLSFSSIVGTTGNIGQVDYCAANAFLDEAAHWHAEVPERRHGRVLSLAWPLWREGGMGHQAGVAEHFEQALGLTPMETQDGLAAFYAALAEPSPHLVVVNGSMERTRALIMTPSPRPASVPAAVARPSAPAASTPAPAPVRCVGQGEVEAYLKSIMGAVLGHAPSALAADAAFSRYGLDSILALDIIRKLEEDLGGLSKTLFFEYENIRQLASYLLEDYADRLATCLQPGLADAVQAPPASAALAVSAPLAEAPASVREARAGRLLRKAALQQDAASRQTLADIDGAAPKGVALLEIWPEVYIDARAQGYCHVLVDKRLFFATQYAGPAAHREAFFTELLAYCQQQGLAFAYLDLTEGRKPDLERAGGLLACPVGAVQVMESLPAFSLAGGRMRRLRYMVERYRKLGECRTVECRQLEPGLVRDIQRVICAWSEMKKVVNNVDLVLEEMRNGSLLDRYRVFLTYFDGSLQNVIMVCREPDGYLMDQEYYLPDMPLGGTEHAVVEIVALLAAEGCERFSLGLTWGLFELGSEDGDPEGSAFLAGTQTQLQQILERGKANRQYKSKYGTRDYPVHLYRRADSDPSLLASCLSQFFRQGISYLEVQRRCAPAVTQVSARAEADHFDATKADPAAIRIDLISDSWAHLSYAFIGDRSAALGACQSPSQAPEAGGELAALFGFEASLLTTSGRAAERLFFQTARRSGKKRVLQNLLFESTLHNLVKGGFEPVEIPDPEALRPDATALFRGGLDLHRLEQALEAEAPAIAMVLVELCNNATGGYPLSLAQLQAVAARCRRHGVPLVLDVTRILKNAELIRRHEPGQSGRELWDIVRAITSEADALVGSLCKDFGLDVGGLLASRDPAFVRNSQGLGRVEGGLPAELETQRIQRALADRDFLASQVARQLDRVRDLHLALAREGVPVIQPGAGHCVLVRVDCLPPLAGRAHSRESYLRLLLERYGIRGGLHLVGNLRDAALNQCVRLALPLQLEDPALLEALSGALKASLVGAAHATPDLLKRARHDAAPKPVSPAPAAADADAIAVIGLAGRYPGAATLQAFWDQLLSGQQAITEVPQERWDWQSHFAADPEQALAEGKSYGKWGAFLEDFAAFDPLFFNIAPIEAGFMDPQERLFLQACWHALEDAGRAPSTLSPAQRAKVGVFGGITKQGFNLHSLDHAQPYQGTSLAALVNRVSHCLDLKGPAMAYDSHCASALIAIHEACNYLRREPDGLALAGAVNLNLHPSTYAQLSKMQVLAANASSAAFAREATGYVPGEGVGVVVLKRHQRALADGDPVYAVIRGSAVNHNGRMNRFGMPSQKQQEAVIREAMAQGDIDPRTISYIEAAAHGSPAGDAIEMAALTRVFGGQRQQTEGSYRIGSLKPNIGHGEAVSGMAQLTKVLLALKHRQLPPTLLIGAPSPAIDFAALPFEVHQTLADWAPVQVEGRPVPRRAGITSTGASGLNAHLVVEEHLAPDAAPVAQDGEPVVFVLSARDRSRLKAYARRWQAFLTAGGPLDLVSLAYTQQVGRDAMACRLAVVARSQDELAGQLARWCDDACPGDDPDVHGPGAEEVGSEPPAALADDAPLQALRAAARRWAAGAAVDWQALLRPGLQPRRLAGLPTYPFADGLYWTGPAKGQGTEGRRAAPPTPVPTPTPTPTAPALAEGFLPRFAALLADAFQIPAEAFDLNRPFEDYGINSFLVKLLNSRLAEVFGALSKTLLFEHQTGMALAQHLLAKHAPACARLAGVAPAAPAQPMAQATAAPALDLVAAAALERSEPVRRTPKSKGAAAAAWDEPVAIVGLSGRYPQAATLQAFWANLQGARDSITTIPPDRWPLDGFYESDVEAAIESSRCYGKWGGFIDGFAEFDPLFFNLSPREAANMDPQERIFLQACWEALEDAGYTRARIASQHQGRLGVFAGITRSEFSLYGNDKLKKGKAPFTSFCSLVNRVSYFLDANGPSIPIDTMCSSSLVAVHEACEKLRFGECEMAIAGGVNLSLHPYMYISLSAQRMLSQDGRCKSFGLGGNGYVPGEGVGVIVLKPLSAALRDGDSIHALIRGTSVNHGGKTNGYTVPNPKAQGQVIRQALERAGVHARAISYIEAHGTGTELGDPIEVTGLSSAFAQDTQDRGFCALGSVKSNIGHLEAASGIAGLTKVLLQMKHGTLVPSLHADELNPNIDFDASPFFVNRELRPWQRPLIDGQEQPRLAGVSSFGAGGTNAHVVLQEYEPPPPRPAPAAAAADPVLIVLSAKKPDLLERYARDLLVHVKEPAYRGSTGAQRLQSLAYTLQVGREAMEARLGLVVSSVQELESKLQRFVDGDRSIEGMQVGRVGRSSHHVD